MVELKHIFFRYFTFLAAAFAAALVIVVAIVEPRVDWPMTVAVLSAGLSLIYFVQKQKLEELRLFNQLFTTFNERYDTLNEAVAQIAARNAEEPLSSAETETLVDYFNLCGEEFLYYRLGYIYPEVWRAWNRGMRDLASNPRIRTLWEHELRTDSYYGFSRKHLQPLEGASTTVRVAVQNGLSSRVA